MIVVVVVVRPMVAVCSYHTDAGQVTNDAIVEPVRVIAVNLSCSVGGSTQTASASVDVYDDDVTPSDVQFTQTSALVNEGDVVNLAVTKTGGSSQV